MGVESSMGLFPDHTAPSQGPAGTGAYKKPIKKGYAGYGDTITPAAGSLGGVAGYAGVPFAETKGGLTKKMLAMGPSFMGGPVDQRSKPQTTAEVTAYRNKSGVAPTAQNMGSLAVQSRADDAEARKQFDGRGQSVSDKSDYKILTVRAQDRTKRFTDASRAKTAFKQRYDAARQKWAGNKGEKATPSNQVRGHTNQSYAGPSSRGLSASRTPNTGVRPNSPYGLF